MATNQICWQFNLVKKALHKKSGNGCLRWKGPQDILLDVEVALNCGPLTYLEDDIQMPTLTPNAMMFVGSMFAPELAPHHLEDADLRKWAKYLFKEGSHLAAMVKGIFAWFERTSQPEA